MRVVLLVLGRSLAHSGLRNRNDIFVFRVPQKRKIGANTPMTVVNIAMLPRSATTLYLSSRLRVVAINMKKAK